MQGTDPPVLSAPTTSAARTRPTDTKPPAAGTNGFAVTALVCGIGGALLGLIPILSIPALIAGVVALVFGLVGRGRVKRLGVTGKGMATAGVILGSIAIVLGIIGFVIVQNAFDELENDLDEFDSGAGRVVLER
jgi:hypothetical protein